MPMTVHVHLLHQSAPIKREHVRNTYQKGSMFCVMHANGKVEKFPLQHIFRVTED